MRARVTAEERELLEAAERGIIEEALWGGSAPHSGPTRQGP
jgi:hypothetical protein